MLAFFRKFDLFGMLWSLLVSGFYLGYFVQADRVYRELDTPLHTLSWGAAFPAYAGLSIGAAAFGAAFYRPLLKLVIALVALGTGILILGGLVGPASLPPSEWLRMLVGAAATIMISEFVLNMRAEQKKTNAEKALAEEFSDD